RTRRVPRPYHAARLPERVRGSVARWPSPRHDTGSHLRHRHRVWRGHRHGDLALRPARHRDCAARPARAADAQRPRACGATRSRLRSQLRLGIRLMRRIGIDVGGTNTDAVLLEEDRIVHAAKTPTTPDVTAGIVTALGLLTTESRALAVDAVMIGTTHFT